MSARDDERPAHAAGRPTRMIYVTAAAVLAADQATKLAAVVWLRPARSIPVLGPYLSLTYATNTGGAFGVLPAATGVLVAVAVVVVILLVIAASRIEHSRMAAVAVACLLGGALGNLVDRLRVGHVIDFIDLHFWPIFNLADIAIVLGAGLLVISTAIGSFQHHAPEESD